MPAGSRARCKCPVTGRNRCSAEDFGPVPNYGPSGEGAMSVTQYSYPSHMSSREMVTTDIPVDTTTTDDAVST
jgi:hypothetical protein